MCTALYYYFKVLTSKSFISIYHCTFDPFYSLLPSYNKKYISLVNHLSNPLRLILSEENALPPHSTQTVLFSVIQACSSTFDLSRPRTS